jgi:hypothetical protein
MKEVLPFAACYFIFVVSAGAADVTMRPDSRPDYLAMSLRGQIELGDLFKVQAQLSGLDSSKSRHFKRRALYLDSQGGSPEEALRIGRFLHLNRIRTIISADAHCESACALLFLGGANERNGSPYRQKSSQGILGFHAYRPTNSQASYNFDDIAKTTTAAQKQMFNLVTYFVDVDADPRILEFIADTDPTGMHYIRNDEAIEYCIYVWNEESPAQRNPVDPYKIRTALNHPPDRLWREARCR